MQTLQLRGVSMDEYYETLYNASKAIAHHVLIVGTLAPGSAVLSLLLLPACCPCLPAVAACLLQPRDTAMQHSQHL